MLSSGNRFHQVIIIENIFLCTVEFQANGNVVYKYFNGDTGMANCEKQVEQEAAYPIPISLYNCYRTVRHEKRGIAI